MDNSTHSPQFIHSLLGRLAIRPWMASALATSLMAKQAWRCNHDARPLCQMDQLAVVILALGKKPPQQKSDICFATAVN